MRRTNLVIAALLAVVSPACDDNKITGYYAKHLALSVVSGDSQYAVPGTMAEEPLRVRLEHIKTHGAAANMEVTWTVVTGSGAQVVPERSLTNADGIAVTRVRLGSDTGSVTVEATFAGIWGPAPHFTLRATPPPVITEIEPARVQPGETVTIRGERFRATSEENAVFFDGFRATITSASANELRAIVPACMTTRQSQVRVALGALLSAPTPVDVYGARGDELRLEIGELRRFDRTEASCLRLPRDPIGASYLVVAQNTSFGGGESLALQLAAVTGQPHTAESFAAAQAHAHPLSPADAWHARLRLKEQAMARRGVSRRNEIARLQRGEPKSVSVGDERDFSVPDAELRPVPVSAVVRAVGKHAVIYEDRAAPTGGFTSDDYNELVRLFDERIYSADVEVFGEPSDLDGNGRVIILLSPEVNKLTPRESDGYTAGFFYACDLDDSIECGGSLVEIVYALVPDPNGKFGIAHKRETLMRTLPSVLAHELQHMIHLNRRVLVGGHRDEALWLKEALAHAAEDVMADEFERRGDLQRAQQARRSNYLRADDYLKNPGASSIVDFTGYGTLEQRGGAWLFLKYLAEHYGGNLLGRLTDGSETGVANITAVTGNRWDVLLSDWAAAMYTAALPASERALLDRRYRYISFDLDAAISSVSKSGYSLRPTNLPFSDFVSSTALPTTASSFTLLSSTSETNGLSLSLTGTRGRAPAPADAQLSIMRVR